MSTLQSSRVRLVLTATLTAILIVSLFVFKGSPSSSTPSSLSWRHRMSNQAYSSHDDVANATLGFERIYVINLPERTDKKDGMTLQAAVSDIKLEFVNGVHPDSILEKALPINHEAEYKTTWVAAWRSHMNVISEIVRKNLTSALIMEDDIDWDISLKTILKDIAVATSAISKDVSSSEMNIDSLSYGQSPQISPYGDSWDVIWLGHCGTKISDRDSRVYKLKDPKVPQPHYLHSWDPNEETPLSIYPNHTRMVGHLTEGTCSLAYAVSQTGARKLLYDMGILHLDMGFDLMLGAFCSGSRGRVRHNCLGVLPPVFEHYRRAGSTTGDSDLHNIEPGYRDKGFTMNLRQTVALNMDRLLSGSTEFDDQYPDT